MQIWHDLLGIDVLENDQRPETVFPDFLNPEAVRKIWNFHRSVPGYRPTPLIELRAMAARWKIKGVFIKDESQRFGLNSFKALGGIYALSRILGRELGVESDQLRFNELLKPEFKDHIRQKVFATATDGNHGRGVAWSAAQLGADSVIFMPVGSSPYRCQKIREAGAREVIVTDMSYDDTVRLAAKTAAANGWTLVQDTSWPGYEEIPLWICQGYTTMAYEAGEQLLAAGVAQPTHAFLQAGVGSMAGGILGYLHQRYWSVPPITSIIEPSQVACVYASALANDGKTHAVSGVQHTIMAGLNCGETCTVVWPILRDLAAYYFTCPDFVAARGMRLAAHPLGGDPAWVSGESGAVPLGLLSLILERPELEPIKKAMGFNSDSVVLLFSTEGNTDPDTYEAVLFDGAYPTPVK